MSAETILQRIEALPGPVFGEEAKAIADDICDACDEPVLMSLLWSNSIAALGDDLNAARRCVPEGCGYMLRRHETAKGMRSCASILRPATSKQDDGWDRWAATDGQALLSAALSFRGLA